MQYSIFNIRSKVVWRQKLLKVLLGSIKHQINNHDVTGNIKGGLKTKAIETALFVGL